ncbi:MAG: non-heme iron oxygenase ferredoxin subunit [Caldilineaceae bacterium]|uniref:Non-heme iron oxygenase ferredoxin subunit n=1 Tax=Caldilineaceae bacterium SB0675_bin_29 TaxID=2605266 RepID=A0A6B1G5T7_9CHLR|nr:non-heme iron oxygenase ferredoxin subunit [Caldilineaceae bacterium]MYH63787.1 non-heme iron oxygenase ferredoxin subunit [Caldilineaceae bacterium SB0675_bin_29]
MEDFERVAAKEDLPPGESLLVELDGIRIAVFNLDGEFYAIEDVCTHDGGPLVEGQILDGGQVECPRHGARFDIRTGEALSMPAFEPTPSYEVQVEDGDIYVEKPF